MRRSSHAAQIEDDATETETDWVVPPNSVLYLFHSAKKNTRQTLRRSTRMLIDQLFKFNLLMYIIFVCKVQSPAKFGGQFLRFEHGIFYCKHSLELWAIG
jgi:hypothetical protein